MIAAIIYAACRDSDIPLTLNDISKATALKKNLIVRYYRAILVNLNLRMPVSNINQCVLRILKNINESEKVKQYAFDILDNAKKRNNLAGKDPTLAGIPTNITRFKKIISF